MEISDFEDVNVTDLEERDGDQTAPEELPRIVG